MISPSRSNRKETTARTISFFAGILVVLTLLASACGDSAQPTPTPTPTPIPPTQTSTPTPTAVPTATPAPTATPEPTATPTPVPTPTVTPEPLPDSAAILEDGLQATRSLDSYAAEMEMSIAGSSGGISLEVPIGVDGAFQPPDRSKGKVTIDFGGFKFEFDFVNIGDDAYMTDPGSGMWMKDDTGSGDLDFFLIIDSLLDFDSDDSIDLFGNLDYIGVEDLDGIETHHIRASLSDAILEDLSPDPGEYAIEYWVGVDDGLVHRITVLGDAELSGGGDPDSLLGGFGSGNIEVNIELTLSDFNVPVDIEAPEGAVSVPPELDPEDYEIDVEGTPLFEIEQDNGWVLYDMPTVGLAIAAPPSWSVYALDAPGREKLSEDLKTKSPDIVAQIEDFTREVEGQTNVMMLGLDTELPDDAKFASNFNIVVSPIPPGLDLDTIANLSLQEIESRMAGGEASVERIELPAGDAAALQYSVDQQLMGGDVVRLGVVMYLVIDGSNGVAVTFSTQSDGTGIPERFGEMMETLELYAPLPFGQSADSTSPETVQQTPTQQPTPTPKPIPTPIGSDSLLHIWLVEKNLDIGWSCKAYEPHEILVADIVYVELCQTEIGETLRTAEHIGTALLQVDSYGAVVDLYLAIVTNDDQAKYYGCFVEHPASFDANRCVTTLEELEAKRKAYREYQSHASLVRRLTDPDYNPFESLEK